MRAEEREGERRSREAKKNMERRSVCDICLCKSCIPLMHTTSGEDNRSLKT